MNTRVTRLVVVMSFVFLSACGMDQDDIRKYAIKRPKDTDAPPASQTPPPNATTSPATTASVDTTALSNSGPAVPAAATTIPPATPPNSVANVATGVVTGVVPDLANLSDTRSPGEPLDELERRRITIDNLKRIAAALQQYVADKGAYPTGAIQTPTGSPLLSWRVELLPYLGYPQLYQAFHLDEAWTTPHNQALLRAIPAVYQSPERFDENTNYV
ncbi:MAG: DUF1559 domain-containing protein, partial [Planctomycetales bacterium]|nr:DUF1559 domain-containing protein [Planctomycetales bacterium]